MATELKIPKKPADPALDQQALYALGIEYIQRLASKVWTDYNIHDPGITTLELLCYALTDLSYRASYRIEDLLSTSANNEANMKSQFFTARQILPNRALTLIDYRKLLIDLKGVKNAWLKPAQLRYYADTIQGTLLFQDPGTPGIREVNVRGLYDVVIDYMDGVVSLSDKDAIMTSVKDRLNANRNLCEDFVSFSDVQTQSFILCAEMELEPDADVAEVKAKILFEVQQYLAPSVNNYTLSDMLEKRKPDGELYTADRIFDGPALDCGFIDDYELAAAELREEIRLSDIISIIMDIDGVRAVRDIVINPEGTAIALENKWSISVDSGKKALLNNATSRLVFYKRAMPIVPSAPGVDAFYAQLVADARTKLETATPYDLDIPLGRFRSPDTYHAFQNHYPVIYGLSESGLSSAATDERRALAYQLKAYLLFFDQVLANYMAQLSHVKELFSTDETLQQTYFYQVVNSFADFDRIYTVLPANVADTIRTQVEKPDVQTERRSRFLDHLIARFAERFSEYVSIMHSAFGTTPDALIQAKCRFLNDYPVISGDRSLAYNHSLQNAGDLWDSDNVSGLEKRLARILGMNNARRRNLSDIELSNFEEGLYLIENILLRPPGVTEPFLPICVDPNCTECPDDDPYSFRLHIILPAYAGRFTSMDFRRFAEEVIRQETPAHVLPKVCWISKDDMTTLEKAYRDWIESKPGALAAFSGILYGVKNVYPTQQLFECDAGETQPKFILGQTALGSGTVPNE